MLIQQFKSLVSLDEVGFMNAGRHLAQLKTHNMPMLNNKVTQI